MTNEEYKLKVEGFMNPATIETKEKRFLNAALGLAAEAGECADHIKKWIFHGKPLDREALKKELGDVQFYFNEYLSAIDTTLEEIQLMNVAKLSARYPDGFNTADSIAKKDENENN